MDAVLLASHAGALFGALAVTVRAGLARRRDAEAGALVTAAVGCFAAVLVAVPFASFEGGSLTALWPFALAGAIVPGLSQLVFVRAVRDAGASRTAVIVGTAPLLSAVLAIAFLDEPLRPALAVATVAIVLGGALLAGERSRLPDFRVAGALLALAAAGLFAVRDNVVRWAALDTGADPFLAAAVSLAAAALVLSLYLATARSSTEPFRRLRAVDDEVDRSRLRHAAAPRAPAARASAWRRAGGGRATGRAGPAR